MVRIEKVIMLLLLAIVVGIGRLEAQQTVKFNFSRASRPVSGWVNVYGDPSDSVIVKGDAVTGITLSSVATANWSRFGVGCSYDGGGTPGGTFFPDSVMMNQWSQYSDFYAAYNGMMPQFMITGLNADSVYTIKMSGSFNDPNDFINPNPTKYSVAGTSVYGGIELNCGYNTTNGAVFHNIAPDATGKIKIYVNTADGSTLACISGIQVIRERTTAPTPVVSFTHPSNNDVILEDNGNVLLSATATETGGSITKVEFYIDSTKIGEDSTSPYSITWLSPDEGKYKVKARAIDGLGNTGSATINVSVEPLSSFWSMTGNIAANADTNFVGTVDTNRLAFRTNNLERMSILADGTIGIGTKNTQGYKLAVNGSAIFTKVRIKAYAGWPDYVFGKNYKLPGLDSVERYIRLHQHLPGLTPAAEVKKEGIDMADGQAALLKKIEELTLYLIEEHKRVEQLSQEVERLKTKSRKSSVQSKQAIR